MIKIFKILQVLDFANESADVDILVYLIGAITLEPFSICIIVYIYSQNLGW